MGLLILWVIQKFDIVSPIIPYRTCAIDMLSCYQNHASWQYTIIGSLSAHGEITPLVIKWRRVPMWVGASIDGEIYGRRWVLYGWKPSQRRIDTIVVACLVNDACRLAVIPEATSSQWRHNGRDGVSFHQPPHCLLNRLFRHRWNKKSKARVTGFCEGNSPVTSEFTAQRASNEENVSIWLRHHFVWCSLVLATSTQFVWIPCICRWNEMQWLDLNIRYPLKFHTKYLTHTLKDMTFIRHWNCKSS